MHIVQGSLLDAIDEIDAGRTVEGRPRPGPLGELVERTVLDRGAWVDLRRGWMSGSGVLLARLVEVATWRAERRRMYERVVDVPRLLCFYDEGEDLPDPALRHAREALDAHYSDELGERFRTAGLCLYRNGRDSVAWHGDTTGRGRCEDTMVAILSLGTPRALLLRPRGGGPVVRYAVGGGDLLVMGGTCQRTWEHAVAKTARAVGVRVSVQFRPHGVR